MKYYLTGIGIFIDSEEPQNTYVYVKVSFFAGMFWKNKVVSELADPKAFFLHVFFFIKKNKLSSVS